jgi:hypothetical protein
MSARCTRAGTSKVPQHNWRYSTFSNDRCSVNHRDFRCTFSEGLHWASVRVHVRSIAFSLDRMRCLDGAIYSHVHSGIRLIKLRVHGFKGVLGVHRSSTCCSKHIWHRSLGGAYMLRSTLGHAQQMKCYLLDHVLVRTRLLSQASTSLCIQNVRVRDGCVQAEKEKPMPPFLGSNVRTIRSPKLILHVDPPHVLRIARLNWSSRNLSHCQPHSTRNLQSCLNRVWAS